MDTTPEEPLMGVVAEIFATWTETLADKLALAGLTIDRARSIATTALASLEGSLILCRARGTSDPLEVVAGGATPTRSLEETDVDDQRVVGGVTWRK